MAYNVADCAHNKVCTKCPSRIDCEIRRIFYNEGRFLEVRNHAFFAAYSYAQARSFSHSECNKLAEESVAVMDHRRDEEMKLHPLYSET